MTINDAPPVKRADKISESMLGELHRLGVRDAERRGDYHKACNRSCASALVRRGLAERAPRQWWHFRITPAGRERLAEERAKGRTC